MQVTGHFLTHTSFSIEKNIIQDKDLGDIRTGLALLATFVVLDLGTVFRPNGCIVYKYITLIVLGFIKIHKLKIDNVRNVLKITHSHWDYSSVEFIKIYDLVTT